jgi:hypothetical protein
MGSAHYSVIDTGSGPGCGKSRFYGATETNSNVAGIKAEDGDADQPGG